jgi:hypothetical protein
MESDAAIAFSSIIALAVTSSGYAIFGTSISHIYPNSGFPTESNESINLSFFNQAEHFIILFFGGSAIGLGILRDRQISSHICICRAVFVAPYVL